MIIILKLKSKNHLVLGIWNTKYHLPKKYSEKYLNAHVFGILFKYQFLSIWPNTGKIVTMYNIVGIIIITISNGCYSLSTFNSRSILSKHYYDKTWNEHTERLWTVNTDTQSPGNQKSNSLRVQRWAHVTCEYRRWSGRLRSTKTLSNSSHTHILIQNS